MGKNAMLHIGFFPMRHTYIFIQNAANEVQRNRFRGTNRLNMNSVHLQQMGNRFTDFIHQKIETKK